MNKIDGKGLSAKIKDELKGRIESYIKKPILAVITIGNDPASEVYVNNKRKAAEYVCMSFLHIVFDDKTKEEKIIEKIKELNNDKTINGIIVQLPLPKGYNEDKIINSIDYTKDVDGLTEISMSKLLVGKESFVPCTTKGIMEIFDYYKIDLEGKNVVIIGRSNLVGKPTFLECLKRNATVTLCHSKTKDLKNYTKNADILIAACGKKYLVDESMIKNNAVIIDVGINRIEGKIYGDVNPNVEEKASYVTPVPGGVGPMTVVCLLKNTFEAYKLHNGVKDE